MTNEALTREETELLATIAAMIIPPSEAHVVPGADDPEIFDDVLAAAAREPATVRAALIAFTAAGSADRFRDQHPEAATCLQTLVALCYYRDARVLRSLGKEARAPYPGGYDMEPGDLSLLDPVRARPPLWRQVDK